MGKRLDKIIRDVDAAGLDTNPEALWNRNPGEPYTLPDRTYPLHIPPPKYPLSREDQADELFKDDVPLDIDDELRRTMKTHNLSADELLFLWNRIPNVLRERDGRDWLNKAIFTYLDSRAQEKAFAEYKHVAPGGAAVRGPRNFGGVTIVSRPRAPRDKRAAVVVLEDTRVEDELRRRLQRGIPERQKMYQRRLQFPKQCANLYARRPWIADYEYTLIGFPEKVDERYVLDDTDAEYNEIVLYKPNVLFSMVNCNKYSKQRRQDGDVFVAHDDNGEKVEFHVVHFLTTGQSVMQTEEIFAKETGWLKFAEGGRKGRLEALLGTSVRADDQLDRGMRSIARNVIAESFGAQALDEYVLRIEEAIYNFLDHPNSIRDYFSVVSDIVIFLSDKHFGKYAHTFKKRVSMRVYNASNMYLLSREEKFPEIFLNMNVSAEKAVRVENLVHHALADQVTELGHRLYALQHPTERLVTRSEVPVPLSLSVPESRRVCANTNDIPEWQVVQYTDEKQTFCFGIEDLVEQFSAGDYINKHTDKRFDQSFVDEILSTFTATNIISSDPVDARDDAATVDAPDLLALLRAEIAALETRLVSLPRSELNKVCDYCRAFVRDGVSSINSSGEVVDFCNTECLSKL